MTYLAQITEIPQLTREAAENPILLLVGVVILALFACFGAVFILIRSENNKVTRIAKLEERIDNQMVETDKLRNRMRDLERDVDRISSERDRIKEERDTYKMALDTKDAELRAAQVAFDGKLDALRIEFDQKLKDLTAQWEPQINALKQQRELLQRQLNDANRLLQEKDALLESRRLEFESYQAHLGQDSFASHQENLHTAGDALVLDAANMKRTVDMGTDDEQPVLAAGGGDDREQADVKPESKSAEDEKPTEDK